MFVIPILLKLVGNRYSHGAPLWRLVPPSFLRENKLNAGFDAHLKRKETRKISYWNVLKFYPSFIDDFIWFSYYLTKTISVLLRVLPCSNFAELAVQTSDFGTAGKQHHTTIKWPIKMTYKNPFCSGLKATHSVWEIAWGVTTMPKAWNWLQKFGNKHHWLPWTCPASHVWRLTTRG